MWWLNILVSSAFIGCYSHAKFGDSVVVTDSGRVSGWERSSRDGRVYQAWTAIPYAEPPVGTLRFRAPKPKTRWEGVLDATGDAPMCVQASKGATVRAIGSEDCLYLNVFRPKIKKENMPVIVYVHGGGFQVGKMGERDWGEYLMDEDVVLVTIQYRLNSIGFMSLGDSVMPGNFGTKDQVLALKWVKRNIAAFGGNPNSVTVVGDSAGGASTHILLKTPATDELIHRAVSDSGNVNRFWSMLNPEHVRRHTLTVARKSGCTSEISQEVMKCLQGVDVSVIITNMVASDIEPSVLLFVPVIEPEDAEDAVATFDLSLRPTKKPWITSTATGEWLLFVQGNVTRPSDVRKYLLDYLSWLPIHLTETQANGAAEVLEKFYFSSGNTSAKFVEQKAKMEADMSFLYPIMTNIVLHEGPKWIYRYEYVDEQAQESLDRANINEELAPHASQVDNYMKRYTHRNPAHAREDYKVSKRIIKYIVNFAYHNDPTPESSPFKWKQFNTNEILRVTKLGDIYADEEVLRKMKDPSDLWDTIIGWKDRIAPYRTF